MPLNRDFVGRACDSAEEYVVGREKIRDFANAIGDTHPYFLSAKAAQHAGYQDVIAPPTFAVVVTSGSAGPLLFDPDFGLDYSRVVHGEQAFRHVRPITAGDVLSTRSEIVKVRDAGRHEMVETRTDVRDQDGHVVCVATNVIVSRGTAAQEPSA